MPRGDSSWGALPADSCPLLVRCLPVAEVGNDDKDDVRNPGSQHRWRVSLDGKGGRYGLQEDVGRAQCQTNPQVETHSAFPLSGGERRSYDGKNEGGKRHSYAFVKLNFIRHHVA